LNLDRIKTLAVSFVAEGANPHAVQADDESSGDPNPTVNSTGALILAHTAFAPHQAFLANGPSTAATRSPSTAPPLVPPGVLLASSPAPIAGVTATAGNGHFNAIINPVAVAPHPLFPPTTLTHIIASPAMAAVSAQLEERRREKAAAEQEVEEMEARMNPWLVRASRREVEKWVVVKNTDLRAGRWLLYVCPSTRKRRVLRY
jgi:hypothetical protein